MSEETFALDPDLNRRWRLEGDRIVYPAMTNWESRTLAANGFRREGQTNDYSRADSVVARYIAATVQGGGVG
jgi:hypothetical protein